MDFLGETSSEDDEDVKQIKVQKENKYPRQQNFANILEFPDQEDDQNGEEENNDQAPGNRQNGIKRQLNDLAEIKDSQKQKDFRKRGPQYRLKFQQIRNFFSTFAQTRGGEKGQLLIRYMQEFLFKTSYRQPEYSYSVLRLLLPQLDRERGNYDLKQKKLADTISDALVLSQIQQERLKYFKNPNKQPSGAPTGDFGEVFYDVVQDLLGINSAGGGAANTSTTNNIQQEITVGTLNDKLDELVTASDQESRADILRDILRQCLAQDAKWVIRIILQDLQISINQEKVLAAFHEDAPEYFNVTSSLLEVAKEFANSSHSLQNVLRIFHPIRPMLASRQQIDSIEFLTQGKNYIVQTKFDGQRIQVHFNPDNMKFFSRNSNDYTHIYGKKLSPIIRKNVQANSAILDGEIVVIDQYTNMPVQFGMNQTIAMEDDDPNSDLQLCYQVFDILFVQGQQSEEINLMNMGLDTRKKILQQIISPVQNTLEVVQFSEAQNFEDIMIEFQNSVKRNEEGIIIKQIDTGYYPNQRSSKWIQMKSDYIEGMTDTLDLILIGGYFGSGGHRVATNSFEWTDNFSHFLLGVIDRCDQNDPSNCIIYPFTKVGTGYTSERLSQLRNKLRPHWVQMNNQNSIPQYVHQNWKPSEHDRPDAYIDSPNHSVIMEIKAAEIIQSYTFPTDYTLRFPRVDKIREDKDWYESMTLRELKQLIENPVKKAKARESDSQQEQNQRRDGNYEEDDDDGDEDYNGTQLNQQKKRRGQTDAGDDEEIDQRIQKNESNRNHVLKRFQDTNVENVVCVDTLFTGYTFCIEKLLNEAAKEFLEIEIVKHGGEKVQNCFNKPDFVIISDEIDFRVQTLIDKYPYFKVLRPKWIYDSIKMDCLADFSNRYSLYLPEELNEINKQNFDLYGDPFFKLTSNSHLRGVLEDLKVSSNQQVYELPFDLFKQQTKLKEKHFQDESILSGQVYCFYDSKNKLDEDLEIMELKLKIKSLGGETCQKLVGKINFLVALQYDDNELQDIQTYRKKHQFEVVTLEKLQKL